MHLYFLVVGSLHHLPFNMQSPNLHRCPLVGLCPFGASFPTPWISMCMDAKMEGSGLIGVEQLTLSPQPRNYVVNDSLGWLSI